MSLRLLNVLEVIAPFKHFNKLREFVQMKLPPGFPVKLGKQSFIWCWKQSADWCSWLFHVMCSSCHPYNCALGSPQTSPCFLRSRPRWRFRSFATMSLMNPFLAFPMIIKKTLAASPTFNLTHWTLNRKQATRQHYATEGTFWILETKQKRRGIKTAFCDYPSPAPTLNTDDNQTA